MLNEFNGGGDTSEALKKKYKSVIYHARGYHLIKQYSDKPISSAHAFVQYYAKRQYDKFDYTIQQYNGLVQNEFFFHAMRTGELVLSHTDALYDKSIKDTCDFWSINLYTREMVDTRRADLKGERYGFSKTRMLPMNVYLDEFYPECMIHNLTRLTDKPVYITENGCSCCNDDFRIVYLTEYLCTLSEAIKMGVDVRGYLYWSTIDNYEWWSYIPRFGLVDVDRENGFKRTPKPSTYFYRDIIENNGFKQDMLKKYLKEMPRIEDMPILK